MWSRKFYHSFAQLSTEVIGDNNELKGEYATFGAVEPFWCSSSQRKHITNLTEPVFIQPKVLYTKLSKKATGRFVYFLLEKKVT